MLLEFGRTQPAGISFLGEVFDLQRLAVELERPDYFHDVWPGRDGDAVFFLRVLAVE
jgi:hypothetical protein